MGYSLDLELSSAQYAWAADSASLSAPSDLSVEIWVKLEQLPSVAGSAMSLIAKYDYSVDQREYYANITTGNLIEFGYYADVTGNNVTYFTSSSAIVDAGNVGVWTHIAFSIDTSAKTAALWRNGLTRGTSTTNIGAGATSIANGTAKFLIGAHNSTAPAAYLDGKVGMVRIFNDIRTEAEFIADQTAYTVTDANMIGEWKLNNDLLDTSGNSNTLTAVNTPVFAVDTPFVYPSTSGSALMSMMV